jgi:hypothetical protein
MPIRSVRPRRSEGLKDYIPLLYESASLPFLKSSEPWEGLADLIFGPTDVCTDPFFAEWVRREGEAKLTALHKLWDQLRDDILEAHEHYRPGTLPWAAKMFDKKHGHRSTDRARTNRSALD